MIMNYLAQAGIGYLLSTLLRHQLNNNTHWVVNDLLPFSMLVPSMLAVFGLDNKTLHTGKIKQYWNLYVFLTPDQV